MFDFDADSRQDVWPVICYFIVHQYEVSGDSVEMGHFYQFFYQKMRRKILYKNGNKNSYRVPIIIFL